MKATAGHTPQTSARPQPHPTQPIAVQHVRHPARRLGRAALYALVIGLGILFVIPFFWAIMGSLKTPFESTAIPPTWLPKSPQWANYRTVVTVTPFLTFLRNTVFLTTVNIIGGLVSNSMIAYGFARFRFRGRNLLFLILLSQMMLPRELTTIPRYVLYSKLGWLDTYWPLTVPHWLGADPFGVFLLRQFFLTIPREYDEAAQIDGANSFQIFSRIILPLAKPGLAALAIFTFIANWTSFFEPLIYINSQSKLTLATGLTWFQAVGLGSTPKQPFLLAYALLMAAPVIVVFFVAQRYFIRGIVLSGLK